MSYLKFPSVFIKPVSWFYRIVFLMEQGEVEEKAREGGNAEISPRVRTLEFENLWL